MRSSNDGSELNVNTREIENYLDTFVGKDTVNGSGALKTAKEANAKNQNSTEYLKELAGSRHSVIFYADVKGVKASMFSCEGDAEAEIMLAPQEINAERIHAINSVAILSASIEKKKKVSSDDKKKSKKNQKLLTDLFHTIINNPDSVSITAGEGRKGDIIATVTPNELSPSGTKSVQYNLTEMFKNVDLTKLSLSEADLKQAANYFVQNRQFFSLRPYLDWTPDGWPSQPGKEDWSKYFQQKINDDKTANSNQKLNVYNTHLAHQLGINSQSTGIYHLSNALFRGTTAAVLPNAESTLLLKSGKLNNAAEMTSALMQGFVTGMLVIDAINKHSDTFDYVVRGETNSVKVGAFSDKGISSVAYGENTFMSTQFLPAIIKINSAQALINANKILDSIDAMPDLGNKKNLDALDNEIKWMNQDDKKKFLTPAVEARIDALRNKVVNLNVGTASESMVSSLSNSSMSETQSEASRNWRVASTSSESSDSPPVQKRSFSTRTKVTENTRINTPLAERRKQPETIEKKTVSVETPGPKNELPYSADSDHQAKTRKAKDVQLLRPIKIQDVHVPATELQPAHTLNMTEYQRLVLVFDRAANKLKEIEDFSQKVDARTDLGKEMQAIKKEAQLAYKQLEEIRKEAQQAPQHDSLKTNHAEAKKLLVEIFSLGQKAEEKMGIDHFNEKLANSTHASTRSNTQTNTQSSTQTSKENEDEHEHPRR